MDNRSKEKFAADIAAATRIEHMLMIHYVAWLNAGGSTSGRTYSFVGHGCGQDGDFIADEKKVTTAADFLLQSDGQADRRIEIKFNRKNSGQFHLKVAQMQSYIKNDVCVVVFSGIDNESGQARFCCLTPKVLADELAKNQYVKFWPWGGKLCVNWNNSNIPTWHQIQLDLRSA